MSEPTTDNRTRESTRRDFFKGVGAGAVGLSVLGGSTLLGGDARENELDIFDDPEVLEGGLCAPAQLVTDRQAFLVTPPPPVTLDCTVCTCAAPQVQVIERSTIRFTTDFRPITVFPCDELDRIPVSTEAQLVWLLKPRYFRAAGPCGSPIGSFDGRFLVRDFVGPGVVTLFSGVIRGTIGMEPCADPATPTCCHYPRVAGMLLGKGRLGTAAEGCTTRWMFCGSEDIGTNSCEITGWGVKITGVVRCPCV